MKCLLPNFTQYEFAFLDFEISWSPLHANKRQASGMF